MATTPVSICNMALSEFGQTTIQSLDDTSAQARACKLRYEPCRDELLQLHPWNFAMGFKALSLLGEEGDPDGPPFLYAYAYQKPVDCLAPLQLEEKEDKWEQTEDKIYTDTEEAMLKYTKRITDASRFPPLFSRALALYLASRLCVPLTADQSKASQLKGEFATALDHARAADEREGNPKADDPEDTFISARG